MKSIFNLLLCNRRAIRTPAVSREPAFLHPKVHAVPTNSFKGAFFPNTLAVTGCLAVLLGLRYLRAKVSSSAPSTEHQKEEAEAREENDLKLLDSMDSNQSSLTTSASSGKEQDHVLLMVKPAARSAPSLSSIVHAQVFGDSNFRCITRLDGVDIAPGKRSRRSRRKLRKQSPPQISSNAEDKMKKEPSPKDPFQKSEQGTEKSCVIAHSVTPTDEPPTNKKELITNSEADNKGSLHAQSTAAPTQDKKPRRRLNRDPRPRHRNRDKKPPQHVLRVKGNPDLCSDDKEVAELPRSGMAPDQKESQTPSGSNEISPRLAVNKRHPRRKAFRRSNGENAERRSDRMHHAPGTTRGRREDGHWKEPSRTHSRSK